MGEAVDYSFSQLTPEDLHAIVAYVRSVPATSSRDVPSALHGLFATGYRDDYDDEYDHYDGDDKYPRQ